jgi:hypothetical protein
MEIPVPPAEPSTFRRLVERKITTEEYLRSLDQRVQETRESEAPSLPSPPSTPEPA